MQDTWCVDWVIGWWPLPCSRIIVQEHEGGIGKEEGESECRPDWGCLVRVPGMRAHRARCIISYAALERVM